LDDLIGNHQNIGQESLQILESTQFQAYREEKFEAFCVFFVQ
jgi:hypothetical protein